MSVGTVLWRFGLELRSGQESDRGERGGAKPGYETAEWGGARLSVYARAGIKDADPERLVQAIRDGWRSAIKAKPTPGRLKTLITRFVRASALDVPGAISIDDALERRFDLTLEIRCGVCRARRVTIRPRWPELRDALASEDVPKEFWPGESIVHRPDEEVLWRYVQQQSGYSSAKVYAKQWISRFSRGVCPECASSARERILARLEGMRGLIQDNATRCEAEQQADWEAAAERVRRAWEEEARRGVAREEVPNAR